MARNTFATLGILAVLLLSFGMVSAAASDNNFTISINGDGTSGNPVTGADGDSIDFTIDFVNTNLDYPEVNLSWSGVAISSGEKNNTGNTSFTPTIDVSASGSSHGLTVLVTNSTGDLIATLTASIYYLDNTTTTPPVISAETFCELEEFTEKGDLEISDFDIKIDGDGSDDEWEYLDQIKIIVEVENTHNKDDIDDVEVTILILDDKIENGGEDVTSDFDFDKETLTGIGKLRDGDEEEVIFIIDELSSDIDEGTYYIYIIAYEDGNEEEHCTSEIDNNDFYFEFSIESVDYEDSIVSKGPEFEDTINTFCGQQNLEITVPVYNLGDDEEERVLVNLYDSEMGIDEYIVLKDMDEGDKETVTFFIDVPEGLTKERYTLDVIVSFDWDDDKEDLDELAYGEANSDASMVLNILGCASPEPSVTASLESSTEVGKDLIVKATITNKGELNDFAITATGFQSWAELISVTPSTLEIASGNSQEVTIILSPTGSGVQTFEITTTVDGETYSQAVSVNVAEKQYPFGMSNTAFYLGIAIASLVVLIFLVLIAKVARRPTAAPNF